MVTIALGFSVFPSLYQDLTVAQSLFAGVFASVLFFVSVILHELSHSLVARIFKIPIKKITLFIFGGVAQMGEEPQSPGAEFYMAAAGPISSLMLAILFGSIWFTLSLLGFPLFFRAPFEWLGLINVSLAIFNLAPGYPLDGGRILRSILWFLMNDMKKSTKIASLFGQGFAYLLIFVGLLISIILPFIASIIPLYSFSADPSGLWLVLIGLFLNQVAKSSYRQLLLKLTLEKIPIQQIISPHVVTVPPDIPISVLVEDYMYKYKFSNFPVVESDNYLIGTISLKDVKSIKKEDWPKTYVKEMLQPFSMKKSISLNDETMSALQKMMEVDSNHLFVVEEGKLVGIITKSDINIKEIIRDYHQMASLPLPDNFNFSGF